MLVVMAQLTVKPGKKAELFGLAKELIAATRAEEGCVSYSLLDDPYDESVCTFVEEWVDRQALERHFGTPHIKAWREKSADLMAGKMAIKLYQAEATKL